MNYIYRDFHLTRLSKDSCTEFLQAVAVSGCTITTSGTSSNGFSEGSVNRWEMWFKLQFTTQDQIDKFHSCGLRTNKPETIAGQ